MAAANTVIFDIDLHAEHGANRLSTQHLTRGPKRHELPRVHNRDAITEHGRVVEVVQRRHHRQPPPDG